MGGKVLEDDPGQRTHIQGVRLDNFARLSGLVRLGLRYSVGPWPLAFPGRVGPNCLLVAPAREPWRFSPGLLRFPGNTDGRTRRVPGRSREAGESPRNTGP